jgi:hypothetical protein
VLGDAVMIDSMLTNGNPSAQLYVTQVSASGLHLNPHEVGILYSTWLQKWLIFNEDQSAMPIGVQFNLTLTNAPNNVSHLTTATVSAPSVTINGTTTPIHLTQVYDAQGVCGCVLNPHPMALTTYHTWWGGTYWTLTNIDNANIPLNAEFFVWG